jgi:hypothetical protein
MEEKVNQLEKCAMHLWHDSSEYAQALEKELRDKGYNPRVTFSGALKPILSDSSLFLSGYNEIRLAYHLN